jgi:hypothetical protein
LTGDTQSRRKAYPKRYGDRSTESLRKLDWVEYLRYLEALRMVKEATPDIDLQQLERALFRIGQDAQTERRRTWGAYRVLVRHLLEQAPVDGPDEVWDEG